MYPAAWGVFKNMHCDDRAVLVDCPGAQSTSDSNMVCSAPIILDSGRNVDCECECWDTKYIVNLRFRKHLRVCLICSCLHIRVLVIKWIGVEVSQIS